MNRLKRNRVILFVALCEGVGALSGLLSREGMEIYKTSVRKPPLSPPPTVFPVAWVILYALIGLGAARVSLTPPSPVRDRGLRLFAGQLAVNFFWSLIFFNRQAFGFAFVWLVLLWALAGAMTLSFSEADRLAGGMQIPYLLWLLFAGYLNFGVWMLNG